MDSFRKKYSKQSINASELFQMAEPLSQSLLPMRFYVDSLYNIFSNLFDMDDICTFTSFPTS